MSGDASTPEQDQTVESGAVPATPEPAPDAPEATSEQAPGAVDPADRMQQLEQELTTLKQEHETLNGQYVRIAADFDNFRKRAQRDKDEARQFANQGLLEKLLPVLDNFEMALTAVKDADPSVRDGVQMILDQLLSVLKESGVVPVDALGQPFDPNLHEALSQEETTDAEEGTVVQQVQCGYKLNDRLVRPARVVVAKAPGTAEKAPTED